MIKKEKTTTETDNIPSINTEATNDISTNEETVLEDKTATVEPVKPNTRKKVVTTESINIEDEKSDELELTNLENTENMKDSEKEDSKKSKAKEKAKKKAKAKKDKQKEKDKEKKKKAKKREKAKKQKAKDKAKAKKKEKAKKKAKSKKKK